MLRAVVPPEPARVGWREPTDDFEDASGALRRLEHRALATHWGLHPAGVHAYTREVWACLRLLVRLRNCHVSRRKRKYDRRAETHEHVERTLAD